MEPEISLAHKIIMSSRNKLLLSNKYLLKAIYALDLKSNPKGIGTDGLFFYYDDYMVLENYLISKESINRVYLHSLIHCLLNHPFTTFNSDPIYGLACDIVVESIALEIGSKYIAISEYKYAKKELMYLKQNILDFIPANVYKYLLDNLDVDKFKKLSDVFTKDSHEYWATITKSNDEKEPSHIDNDGIDDNYKNKNVKKIISDSHSIPNSNLVSEIKSKWDKILKEIRFETNDFLNIGIESGDLKLNVTGINKDRLDYSSFLRKFANVSEVLNANEEEFDLNYYLYGLSNFKNIVLIEPLEYQDQNVIQDLIIAIDTSGSVYGPTVHSFLEKTFSILWDTSLIKEKFNIYIIQCDSEIQSVDLIKTKKELVEYMEEIVLKGFGGTDFRPVFQYIDDQICNKIFTNVQGLLYFTDGFGIFPKLTPNYKTSFIFLEDEDTPIVPSWAIKYVINNKELSDY